MERRDILPASFRGLAQALPPALEGRRKSGQTAERGSRKDPAAWAASFPWGNMQVVGKSALEPKE